LSDIVRWITSEWSRDEGWYGRTSITSMGLALVADLQVVDSTMKDDSAEYLVNAFRVLPSGRTGFSENIIDDAFTVYNLYERWEVLSEIIPPELWRCVARSADALVGELASFTSSPPPFGGAVDSRHYGQAVLARAVMAKQLAQDVQFDVELAVALTNANSENLLARIEGINPVEPFWGSRSVDSDGS
jgi:hypothetical protein